MKEIKTDNYAFDNEIYEIKAYRTDNGFKIISYKSGQRANPYTYSVSDMTDFDFKIYTGENAFEKLMQVAKDDIAQGFVYGKKLK